MKSKKPKEETPRTSEPQELVVLRAQREGFPEIWRSSNGFVSIKGHEDLAYSGSEVLVTRVHNDLKIGWKIVGPAPKAEEKDLSNGANY